MTVYVQFMCLCMCFELDDSTRLTHSLFTSHIAILFGLTWLDSFIHSNTSLYWIVCSWWLMTWRKENQGPRASTRYSVISKFYNIETIRGCYLVRVPPYCGRLDMDYRDCSARTHAIVVYYDRLMRFDTDRKWMQIGLLYTLVVPCGMPLTSS